jgi:hypothetical protein
MGIEASDIAALTQAQPKAEDAAALDAIEKDDPEALNAADSAVIQAITEEEHPQPQTAPKVWDLLLCVLETLLAFSDRSA